MKSLLTKGKYMNNYRKKIFFKNFGFFSLILLLLFATSCNEPTSEAPETVIGEDGIVMARKIATRFPYRKGGTQEEESVAEILVEELKTIGYKPQIVEFDLDEERKSQNIIIKIKGEGFVNETSDDETEVFRRQVIIGAHYDTPFSVEDSEKYPDFDGINDNASGTGALISIAKELKSKKYGYDISLVFFGGGNNDFAGAKYYASQMTKEEIINTDVMYCINSIYAGDKLYAHASHNSLEPGMKYLRRRKLYEISDVAIANSIELRFNESDLDIDVNGDGELDVYREITKINSDYTVFDSMKIPCVFIESFEYFASSESDQIESKNPYFGDTKGMVRGTNYDSSSYLEEVLEEGRLHTRIKNVAFLIIKALEKGVYK